MESTRVTISNESLYGERRTLAGWRDWLSAKFNEVPPEYRDSAVLEIESVGGYEGEHHTEATVYFDRPPTPEEIASRKSRALLTSHEEDLVWAALRASSELLYQF